MYAEASALKLPGMSSQASVLCLLCSPLPPALPPERVCSHAQCSLSLEDNSNRLFGNSKVSKITESTHPEDVAEWGDQRDGKASRLEVKSSRVVQDEIWKGKGIKSESP